jgi:hypothetical protein
MSMFIGVEADLPMGDLPSQLSAAFMGLYKQTLSAWQCYVGRKSLTCFHKVLLKVYALNMTENSPLSINGTTDPWLPTCQNCTLSAEFFCA